AGFQTSAMIVLSDGTGFVIKRSYPGWLQQTSPTLPTRPDAAETIPNDLWPQERLQGQYPWQ
ncbi:MAG: hypothetical protein VW891_12345, partial [Novosphingobium sp.]